MILRNMYFWGVLLFVGVSYWSIRRKHNKENFAKKILQKSINDSTHEPLTLHPEIDPSLCVGCGTCTRVCPEGEILRLIEHKAVLVAPSKCVGHGECERSCPFGAITLVFGTKTKGMDIPRLSTHFETNIGGLYIAGELGGMGLIRNAIKQGHLAASHALKDNTLSKNHNQLSACLPKNMVDLFIVGAGPAGLSASLTAIVNRRSYICIDQNSFGGTVNNFPRQKIVMSHPANLPGFGLMKFPKNKISKEELLQYWKKIKQKAGIVIQEKVTFEGLDRIKEKDFSYFKIQTSAGEFFANKVILAMGLRGSPRKLGIANEDSTKVSYQLQEPQQYQNKKIAIVGAGNSAVEAALMLGRPELQNEVTLLVRGSSLDRCNEENKFQLENGVKKRHVRLWMNSQVKEIHPQYLLVQKGSSTGPPIEEKLENHFLFILAGSQMPFQFLMSLGIEIVKLFGDKQKKQVG